MPKLINDQVAQMLGAMRNDDQLVGFFSRELEFIQAKSYDVLYPELKGQLVIPVDTSVPSGTKTITWESFDARGMAKIISDYAADLPRVGVTGEQNTSKVRSIGDSYGYSVIEIRAAQLAGRPLEQRRATAARTAVEQRINQIAWSGDTEHGLIGFLGQPNVPVSDVPADGTGAVTFWSAKTPEQILRDMNAAITEVIVTSKGVHKPNQLLLPLEQFGLISRTPYNSFTAITILQFFLSNNPGVSVEEVNELDAAGTAGKDVMIAYMRDPNMITLQIPQPFEQFPSQPKNLEIMVPTHAECGGVIVYYPLSANIKEGI